MLHKLNYEQMTTISGKVLFLFIIPAGAGEQTNTPVSTGDDISYKNSTTNAPQTCPTPESCQVVGAVIGSLVVGFILGVLVTYLVRLFLKRKKHHIPPKDYDVRECDVNRNNDGDDQYCQHNQVTPSQPEVREHKKLERVAKQSPTSPGDIEITSASTPLISNESSQPKAAATVKDSTTSNNPKPHPADNNTVVYANVGAEAQLSQPYEDLYIIQEDNEYESFKTSK